MSDFKTSTASSSSQQKMSSAANQQQQQQDRPQWRASLLNCCSDHEHSVGYGYLEPIKGSAICAETLFCWGCQATRQTNTITNSPWDGLSPWEKGGPLPVLFCLFPNCGAANARVQFVEGRQDESKFVSCCIGCLLPWCSIIQVTKELRMEGRIVGGECCSKEVHHHHPPPKPSSMNENNNNNQAKPRFMKNNTLHY